MPAVEQPFGFAYEGIRSFCRMPMCFDPEQLEADVAVVGICFDTANYSRCGARYGPRAIREASMFMGVVYDPEKGFFDGDLGRHVLSGVRIVDCGDIMVVPSLLEATLENVKRQIKAIRSRGAVPVVLGGEHTISIPVFWAFDDLPLHIVQFDSHLDLMDDTGGIKYADANPMKRAIEMDNVTGLTQIGIRGYLNTPELWKEAENKKVTTFTAERVHDEGVESILSQIPECENLYITLDIDALDPAEAPGSGAQEPGGLSYRQMRKLLRGCAAKGRLVGTDVMEVNPMFDPTERTASLAVRMILDLLGAARLV
jgi:agmatinase